MPLRSDEERAERTRLWREYKTFYKDVFLIVDSSFISEIEKHVIDQAVDEIFDHRYKDVHLTDFQKEVKRYEIKKGLYDFAVYHCFIGSGPADDTPENPAGDKLEWDMSDGTLHKKLIGRMHEIFDEEIEKYKQSIHTTEAK